MLSSPERGSNPMDAVDPSPERQGSVFDSPKILPKTKLKKKFQRTEAPSIKVLQMLTYRSIGLTDRAPKIIKRAHESVRSINAEPKRSGIDAKNRDLKSLKSKTISISDAEQPAKAAYSGSESITILSDKIKTGKRTMKSTLMSGDDREPEKPII